MEEIVFKHCSRCNKSKAVEEFTEPNRLCNLCIEDNREYRRCKKDWVERAKEVKEPTITYKLRNYYCEVCKYELRLCKKSQHEQTLYHQDRLRRKEHPEEFENEENQTEYVFKMVRSILNAISVKAGLCLLYGVGIVQL